ncbi:MAG: nuclear transport factor 2 family protein [Chloroflexi bacterium]|nr:nuclear transport factor 2 family protein [Chloroflexota bacterium]MCI0577689.1 nuclear transport factor 2 family protein [Chloroflexota bacterium]MCI0644591.1 nuclear transport factor 2 family protein [Chloroflexota bacterium]MCI0728241.1 nuclear transport factor 2 family protein [Chloroflexota bacterium]
MTTQMDLVALLKAYEDASNRHDVGAAVSMFTEDGCIEAQGKPYCDPAALRAAHEYDLASRTQITLSDFVVEGHTVTCHFVYCDELDRAVGLDGTHSRAVFTFENGRIRLFQSLPPAEAELQRHRQAKRPFRQWAQAHYPEEVAKGFTFDYESGASLFRVVQAWRESQPGGTGAYR